MKITISSNIDKDYAKVAIMYALSDNLIIKDKRSFQKAVTNYFCMFGNILEHHMFQKCYEHEEEALKIVKKYYNI